MEILLFRHEIKTTPYLVFYSDKWDLTQTWRVKPLGERCCRLFCDRHILRDGRTDGRIGYSSSWISNSTCVETLHWLKSYFGRSFSGWIDSSNRSSSSFNGILSKTWEHNHIRVYIIVWSGSPTLLCEVSWGTCLYILPNQHCCWLVDYHMVITSLNIW